MKHPFITCNLSDIEARIASQLEKVENVDCHAERAAKHFGIKIEEVTPEQRRIGKQLNFREFYS